MKTITVYEVMGGSGKYSDYESWSLAAYLNEDDAETHCQYAQEAADRLVEEAGGFDPEDGSPRFSEESVGPNPYDPGMLPSYTGASYWVRVITATDQSFTP